MTWQTFWQSVGYGALFVAIAFAVCLGLALAVVALYYIVLGVSAILELIYHKLKGK